MSARATQTAQKPAPTKPRLGFADPVFAEIMDFLTEEAALLDHNRHMEWVELLAEDVAYTIPTRKTVHMRDGTGISDFGSMPANFEGLKFTAQRNSREDVFDHDPPQRMRRFITNVRAHRTDTENEFAVDSYILLMKTKYDEPTYDFITAERSDVIRRTADGMKLVSRRLVFDQTMLSTQLHNVIL